MDAIKDLLGTGYGWEFIFRYIHFLSGVMWIGVLWYFNMIQTPFFATELGGSAKSAMTRGLVPNALWWFRWGAMFTFGSGWLLILMYIGMDGMSLGDGLITRILTGGAMGTIMWFNVWFIIWPAQRDYAIQSALNVAEGKEPVPGTPEKSGLAARASRTNTLFSIPMLFFMGSARHLTTFNEGTNDTVYWIAALAVILAVELNAVIGTGDRQKYLTTVSGTIHMGLGVLVVLYLLGAFLN